MTFTDAELTHDDFLGGAIKVWQPKQGYRAATDPVFLAASIKANPKQSVLELGCGVGTGLACLCKRIDGLDAHGLEIQAEYAELARRNAADNALDFTVHNGDLMSPPSALREMSFDHVFANPPFYDPAASSAPLDAGRDIAHREGRATLRDWIEVGFRRLKPRGYFTIIHRSERLADILSAMEDKAGDIHILPIAAREGQEARRIIVRARKGAAAKLRLLAPIIVHSGAKHTADEDNYSTYARNILRSMHPIVM